MPRIVTKKTEEKKRKGTGDRPGQKVYWYVRPNRIEKLEALKQHFADDDVSMANRLVDIAHKEIFGK